MASEGRQSVPVLGTLGKIVAIPCSFLAGLTTGLVVPLAAVAGIMAGVRLFTGKFPFLAHVEAGDDGERQLTLALVPPDQLKARWAEQKQTLAEPLGRLKAEIQALSEEAKAKAK